MYIYKSIESLVQDDARVTVEVVLCMHTYMWIQIVRYLYLYIDIIVIVGS